jgi:hypothetical protein
MSKTATYSLIASQTGTGSSGTITFNSIPGTFTDLVLIANPVYSVDTVNTNLRFNGDTGTNYSDTYMKDVAGAVFPGGRDSSQNLLYLSSTGDLVTTSSRDNGIIHIFDYANSTTHKTVLHQYNQTGHVMAQVGSYRSTAAITSISILASTGNYTTNATFKLYGIQAGNA